MKGIVGCNMAAVCVCTTWQIFVRAVFFSKIQSVEMSKPKQVQTSHSSLFGEKQDQENNATSLMPVATAIKKNRNFRNRGKKSTKRSSLMKKKTKCFEGNFQMEKTQNIPWTGVTRVTNNFQTLQILTSFSIDVVQSTC